MNETVQILELAIKNLERGWCRGHSAVRRIGRFEIPVDAHSIFPNAFCSIGAVGKATYEVDRIDYMYGHKKNRKALSYLAQIIGVELSEGRFLTPIYQPIMDWNDQSDQDSVIAVFRQAVELARKEI
jgi:hypothetical protein